MAGLAPGRESCVRSPRTRRCFTSKYAALAERRGIWAPPRTTRVRLPQAACEGQRRKRENVRPWPSGEASGSQSEPRGFDPRRPLFVFLAGVTRYGGEPGRNPGAPRSSQSSILCAGKRSRSPLSDIENSSDFGGIAQLAEQPALNRQVAGSTPAAVIRRPKSPHNTQPVRGPESAAEEWRYSQ